MKCRGLVEPHETPGLYSVNYDSYAETALQILLVCKQIYAEARLLPFTSNTFEENYVSDLRLWRNKMPTQLQAIQSYRLFTVRAEFRSDLSGALLFLPGLKRLEVGVDVFGFPVTLDSTRKPPYACEDCENNEFRPYITCPNFEREYVHAFSLSSEHSRKLDMNEANFRAEVMRAVGREIEVVFIRKNGWYDIG